MTVRFIVEIIESISQYEYESWTYVGEETFVMIAPTKFSNRVQTAPSVPEGSILLLLLRVSQDTTDPNKNYKIMWDILNMLFLKEKKKEKHVPKNYLFEVFKVYYCTIKL